MTPWQDARWELVLRRNPEAREQHERRVRQTTTPRRTRTPLYLLALARLRGQPITEDTR